MPFLWKGNKSKYILISASIICISLYVFQGYSKYQEVEKIKKENSLFQENLNEQQKEVKQTQKTMIEKQDIFLSLLNNLQKRGTLSKDEAKNIKNIYDETVSTTAKSSSKLEDRFLQPIKAAGSVEMKEATLSFDKEHNLLWAIPKIGACTWDKASEFAKTFNMGGYLDWRLPSISEAKIIIKNIKDKESELELIKRFSKLGYHTTLANAPFLKLEQNYYWTVDSKTSNLADAFHPYMGNIEEYSKSLNIFVVLVRNP